MRRCFAKHLTRFYLCFVFISLMPLSQNTTTNTVACFPGREGHKDTRFSDAIGVHRFTDQNVWFHCLLLLMLGFLASQRHSGTWSCPIFPIYTFKVSNQIVPLLSPPESQGMRTTSRLVSHTSINSILLTNHS
jgi:hypothetical protein